MDNRSFIDGENMSEKHEKISINRLLNRVGGVLSEPKAYYDIIIAEGINLTEGLIVSFTAILGTFSIAFSYSNISGINPYLAFILGYGIALGLWFLWTWTMFFAITRIFKLPGEYKEFFGISSYALTTLILPMVFLSIERLIGVQEFPILTPIEFVVGIVWTIWFLATFYTGTNKYFKIDKKQFVTSLIMSILILAAVISAISLPFALFLAKYFEVLPFL